jgi:hypothetical protein
MSNLSVIKFPEYCYPPVKNRICTFSPEWQQLAIGKDDYKKLADEFGINIPLIKTVISVESSGSGFILTEPNPTFPKILLEAHYVYKITKTPVNSINSKLSQPTWGRGRQYYLGGAMEWTKRLLPLMDILSDHKEDPLTACLCCSWGMGQVMGTNFKLADCKNIQQFVEENHAGEYWQARHMMSFVKNTGLLNPLKERNWAKFARGYNGPGYAQNKYDIKLAQAYRNYSQMA